MRQEKQKKRGGEKVKFCFLRMSELCKLHVIFCIWIRRSRSVQPVNGVMVSFSSLQHDSDQKTARLASKRIFQQNFQRQKGSLQKVSGRKLIRSSHIKKINDLTCQEHTFSFPRICFRGNENLVEEKKSTLMLLKRQNHSFTLFT